MKQFLLLFSIVALLAPLGAQAQQHIQQKSLVWYRYYTQVNINKKFSIHGELDNRTNLEDGWQSQFLSRLQARYRFKDWVEMGAGQVFTLNTATTAEKTLLFIPEFRSQIDVTFRHSIGKVAFSHRNLAEARFIHNNDKEILTDGYYFLLRFRYRLQADISLWKKDEKAVKLVLQTEPMFLLNKPSRWFDQCRGYIGANFSFNKAWAFEIGYLDIIQYQGGTAWRNSSILRMSVFHRWSL